MSTIPASKEKTEHPKTTASCKPKSLKQRVLENEIEITGAIILFILAATYLGHPAAKKCLTLSYKTGEDQYVKGLDDVYFISFWVIAFTFLRALSMKYLFHPFAKMYGIGPYSKRERFAEQAWALSTYAVFWTEGMNIMYHSPHWLNTSQFWIDYPHLQMTTQMKAYYLMQIAFWTQQIYTIHIEKRRKDHLAMVTHHFITFILLTSSYCANFTRIGNAVLCCMDPADIFLSLAKVLKYTGCSVACDITFGLFALSWPITRHGLFSVIIWATAVEPSRYIDMLWEPEKGKYFTPFTQKIYILLFVSLNTIMIYWFIMIVKVILRVLQGKNAEDTRSDDEDEDGDEVDAKKEQIHSVKGKHG
ncbi:TLC domain-containing protein [Choanephora cucurbitarum]|nr:TLC domain-containing protein [Choanephora cucurbitarum]